MKIHSQIIYQKPDGTWVHSDTCPSECNPENMESPEWQKYLHDCLSEWLKNSNGTGCFYIGTHEAIRAEVND